MLNISSSVLHNNYHLQKLRCLQACIIALDKHGKVMASTSFHTSSSNGIGVQIKDALGDYYSLLNLKEGCDYKELKNAYLGMAKQYHPDSGAETANAKKFTEIQHAYRTIKENMTVAKEDVDIEEPVIEFDIRHTAPQHRQYLSYDGEGFGTVSQRQRQYQQRRVAQATERVSDHRIQKISVQYEDALVVKDKQAMKKHKTQNYMDRLVEDLIKEAMDKGDFQDLPGTGKPLGYTERNPFVDSTTHSLNKILINDGFTPEWIALEKDIRQELKDCRQTLAKERSYLGLSPLAGTEHTRWMHYCSNFRYALEEVNEKIRRYNMKVPLLQKQMCEYAAEKEIKRICENWESFLPKDFDRNAPPFQTYAHSNEKINWTEVWRHIKTLFSPAK